MNWNNIDTLQSLTLVDDFGDVMNYMFCEKFIHTITRANGGVPDKRNFDTDKIKGRKIKTFLSFNHEDKKTVWKAAASESLLDRQVPFAADCFGNLVCFDADTDKVIFINYEDKSMELIADDFESFINNLY